MQDISKPKGFTALLKRELEPRMNELADLMAANKGKKRIIIKVKQGITVDYYPQEDKLVYTDFTKSYKWKPF